MEKLKTINFTLLLSILIFIIIFFAIPPSYYSYKSIWTDNGQIICVKDEAQYDTEICTDGFGGAIIAWIDHIDPEPTIYAQRIDSNGTTLWNPNGIPICLFTEALGYDFQICSDKARGAIIVWNYHNSTTDYDIFAQRVDSEGVLRWTSKGITICNKINDQEIFDILSDEAGGVFITWEDQRITTDYNIYAQHVNSNGVKEWGVDGMYVCNTSENQGNPKICSDNAGGVIITWNDYRSGTNWDIYAQKIDSLGNIEWKENGAEVCTEIHDQAMPIICTDQSGGMITTWYENRTGPGYDIIAQRLDSRGNISWAPEGVVISLESGSLFFPQICVDGEGGAIIIWWDFISIPYFNIIGQRIDSNGEKKWNISGVVIDTMDNMFFYLNPFQICSDGAKGVYIIWSSNTTETDFDIYAQHINHNGVKRYDSNATAICSADGMQTKPKICSDGAGGCITTWHDYRDEISYDIYGHHIKRFVSMSEIPWNLIILGCGLAFLLYGSIHFTPIIIKAKKRRHIDIFFKTKCEELEKKIPRYRNKNLQKSDFMEFILQFPKDLRKEAINLVEEIEYFSQERMQAALINLIDNLDIMSKNVYLVIMKGFTLKSSGAWSYFTIKSSKIDLKEITPKKLIQKIEGIKDDQYNHFIFLDDVIGTGDQFVKRFNQEVGNLLTREVKQILNSNDKIHFHLVAGVGSSQSRVKISKQIDILDKGEIKFAKTIKELDKAFYTENEITKKESISLLTFLKEKHPLWWAGYRDSQYLVITEWNTPDNTIGCLWKKQKGWKPLFPRKAPSRV